MCCCVPALQLGLPGARREGSHRAPAAPFGAGLVSPLPRAAGHWGGLAQPEGLGGRAELCRAAGQLALVSLPVAGALPPPRWACRVLAGQRRVTGAAHPYQLPALSPFPAKCFILTDFPTRGQFMRGWHTR